MLSYVWFFDLVDRACESIAKHGLTVATAVAMVAAVVLLIKYGPRLFDAHMLFLATATQAAKVNSDAISLIASKQSYLETQTNHLHKQAEKSSELNIRVFQNVCDVADHFAEKLEITDKVEGSVNAIRRELERVSAGE